MTHSHNNPLPGLNVLIVDDVAVVRSILYKILRKLGIGGIIDEAEDGLEAWNKLQQRSYGLVISDVNMPGMNGFELRKQMHGSDLYRFIPFIFYTGEVGVELMSKAAGGNCGYLIKPLRINQLAQVIRSILKS